MRRPYFERAVLGTPVEKDFSRDMLPVGRGRQTLSILKAKWPKLYAVHLLTALFFLPLMIWNYLSISYTNSAFSGSAEESLLELPNYFLTVYGTAVPLWAVAFLGLAGGLYVMRRFAWGENVRAWRDFIHGIKSSGLQTALIGVLFSSLLAVFTFAFYWLSFYGEISQSGFFIFVAEISSIIATAILGAVAIFACAMASLYNVTYFGSWLGGFKLFFASILKSSGVLALAFLPMLIPLLLGSFLSMVIGYFIILLGWLGLALLISSQLCISLFDKYINKKDYPENYLRGLSGWQGNKGADDLSRDCMYEAEDEDIEEGFEIVTSEDGSL